MKNTFKIKGLVALLLLSSFVVGCTGYGEELINGLEVSRAFAPISLTARVRNQTTVELNWTVKENIDFYEVEISADDPLFTSIFKKIKVAPTELPLQVALEGETVYSIRVKAISAVGREDSKWSIVTITTLSEQLFLASQDADIQAKQATFRWVANSNVTELVVNPGNIRKVISASEKAAGVATVTGLVGDTSYNVDLFNGTKKRGFKSFKTLVDIGNGILINPTDDLNAKIAAASAGAELYLSPGEYKAYVGEIILNKSITIRGLYPYNKPKVYLKFTLNTGTADVSLIDLDLNGDTAITGANSAVLTIGNTSTTYGNLLIRGCDVQNYERSLVYASMASSKVSSVTVENCKVTNVNTNAGADFIDFRTTFVGAVNLKTSTFNNCSAGRDFVRVDAGTFSGTGLTTNVLIDRCTLYNVSNIANVPTTAPKRLLYVRSLNNASIVKNTLVAETSAVYSNQTNTATPSYTANYYFNAPFVMDATISGNKPDTSGVVANPQFVNAAAGNFKIQNQTLIDNGIGDPFWR